MISTNADTFEAHQNEPIARQGQRKRRRRKHSPHLPSRTPQVDHPWIANPMARQREHAAFQNTAPTQQNDTQRDKRHDSRTGAANSALQHSSKIIFATIPVTQAHRLTTDGWEWWRTVANGCKLRTLEQLLANTASTPRPPPFNGNPSPEK